jgi:hypothetical protein
MSKFRKIFKDVAKEFFPRWNHEGWSVKQEYISDLMGGWGACSPRTKTILIEKRLGCGHVTLIKSLLIHEICHAVTSGGHSTRFLNRLRKAERHAQSTGRIQLAEMIEWGAKDAEKISKLSAKMVYEAISNFVDNYPDSSFDECIITIAGSHGCDPLAIIRKFKRCKEIFDKVQREIERDAIGLSKLYGWARGSQTT